MTQADGECLALALEGLAEVFDQSLSEDKVAGYLEALSDLTWADLSPAFHRALRESKYFPRPAELRAYVEGDADAEAERAFGELQTAIRRVGGWQRPPRLAPAIEAAYRQLWGSWRHCCESLPADGPELLGWAKRWRVVYGAEVGRRRAALAAAGVEGIRGPVAPLLKAEGTSTRPTGARPACGRPPGAS